MWCAVTFSWRSFQIKCQIKLRRTSNERIWMCQKTIKTQHNTTICEQMTRVRWYNWKITPVGRRRRHKCSYNCHIMNKYVKIINQRNLSRTAHPTTNTQTTTERILIIIIHNNDTYGPTPTLKMITICCDIFLWKPPKIPIENSAQKHRMLLPHVCVRVCRRLYRRHSKCASD